MWSYWLVVCDCGFRLSALWCPLSVPTVFLGFFLPWLWGISSWLLQQSAASAPYLGHGAAPLGFACAPLQPLLCLHCTVMFDFLIWMLFSWLYPPSRIKSQLLCSSTNYLMNSPLPILSYSSNLAWAFWILLSAFTFQWRPYFSLWFCFPVWFCSLGSLWFLCLVVICLIFSGKSTVPINWWCQLRLSAFLEIHFSLCCIIFPEFGVLILNQISLVCYFQ